MRRSFALTLLVGVTLSGVPSLADTGAAPTSANDVYARMQRLNPGLASYQADVTVAILTHGPPYISPTLQGKTYFKKPDKTAVVFDTAPFIAQQVKHLVVTLEPPADWDQIYDVTPVSDDGTTTNFRLVRKKEGRIDHVDVTADDKTATVTGMTYHYRDNGGTIAFTQIYDRVGDDYLIKQQTGKVDIPHYNADVTSTFSHYELNVSVPDSVFSE